MDGASTADNVDAGQGVLVAWPLALLVLLLWSIMLGGARADERLQVA